MLRFRRLALVCFSNVFRKLHYWEKSDKMPDRAGKGEKSNPEFFCALEVLIRNWSRFDFIILADHSLPLCARTKNPLINERKTSTWPNQLRLGCSVQTSLSAYLIEFEKLENSHTKRPLSIELAAMDGS